MENLISKIHALFDDGHDDELDDSDEEAPFDLDDELD